MLTFLCYAIQNVPLYSVQKNKTDFKDLKNISKATKKMDTRIMNINGIIQEIAAASEENPAWAEEITSQIKEQFQGTSKFRTLMNEMNKMAEDLMNSIKELKY